MLYGTSDIKRNIIEEELGKETDGYLSNRNRLEKESKLVRSQEE